MIVQLDVIVPVIDDLDRTKTRRQERAVLSVMFNLFILQLTEPGTKTVEAHHQYLRFDLII